MVTRNVVPIEFELSGTGSEVQWVELIANPHAGGKFAARRNGRVSYAGLEMDTGGGATQLDFYIGHRRVELDTPSAERRRNLVLKAEAIPVTDDADGFWESPITAEPIFSESLSVAVDVTGAGAWTIRGWLDVEF